MGRQTGREHLRLAQDLTLYSASHSASQQQEPQAQLTFRLISSVQAGVNKAPAVAAEIRDSLGA